MTPSIYLNLEDDVSRIVARIKREKADKVVLVCPKRCFLFNDSINLRLLKKQVDLLKKEVFILTMDERGQIYAKEAGFQLRYLPKSSPSKTFSDIRVAKETKRDNQQTEEKEEKSHGALSSTVQEIKNIAKLWGKYPEVEKRKNKAGGVGRPQEAVPQLNHAAPPMVKVTDTIFLERQLKRVESKKPRLRYHKLATGLVVISLLLILSVMFIILPKATVVVYPRTEPITRDIELSMGTNIAEADPIKLIMPAQKVERTLDVSNKFQSQGKKEVGNKASGTIQIYNFTRSPLNLKAGTTILSVGGKNYVLVSDISQLPPTAYKNAATKEVDERTLAAPVEIRASEGGDSYNLPAGTRMEITNQVFGNKPQYLYAVSATPMTGGTSRFLSVVTEQDINDGKSALEAQALSQLREDLAKDGAVLADKSYIMEDLQYNTDKAAGIESPNFNASLQVKITGIAFKESTLYKLIYDRIGQTLPDDKYLDTGTQPISYKIKNVDLNNGTAAISAHFEGRAVYKVDLDGMPEELTGKTQNQVSEILRSKTEIDKIETTLAPSWQRNFPWFAGKITVKTQIDDTLTQ